MGTEVGPATLLTSLNLDDISVQQMLFSPDGQFLALLVTPEDRPEQDEIHIYDGQTFTHLGTFGTSSQQEGFGFIEQMAFASNKLLGLVRYTGILEIWDVFKQELLISMDANPGYHNSPAFGDTRCLDWAPNGRWLATGGWDNVELDHYEELVKASGWEQLPGPPRRLDLFIRLWQVRREEASLSEEGPE